MLTLNRPAFIESCEQQLDSEFRAARWAHHRLLDFETLHQKVLDDAAELCAPGIGRVGKLVSRLSRNARRREHTTEGQWSPNPHPLWAKALRGKLHELRKQRNSDPRWREALKWADTPGPGAPARGTARQRKGESDADFRERCEKRRNFLTRREQYRSELYAHRTIYWGTWNGLLKAVDKSRATVLERRKQGLAADMRRPKYRDSQSLFADHHGVRIIERGPLWWVIEMRLGLEAEWVRFRAKCGSWHPVPDDVLPRTATLTRHRDGERYRYSISLTFAIDKPIDSALNGTGTVALDWGHREHGHERAREGMRAFAWTGEDGQTGEVLIPTQCREMLDEADTLKSRVDVTFVVRRKTLGLPEKNRYRYRQRLMLSGVRTLEESQWLSWEMRYERRIAKRLRRVQNIRREVYTQAIRALRKHYSAFVFEKEVTQSIKDTQTQEEMPRRKRANRDLATRYEFISLCERLGATIVTVPSRNTTRECPECGHLSNNGPELLIVCEACGVARDKDFGATRVIMRRGKEALEMQAQSA